jgi:hypothetical protein
MMNTAIERTATTAQNKVMQVLPIQASKSVHELSFRSNSLPVERVDHSGELKVRKSFVRAAAGFSYDRRHDPKSTNGELGLPGEKTRA